MIPLIALLFAAPSSALEPKDLAPDCTLSEQAAGPLAQLPAPRLTQRFSCRGEDVSLYWYRAPSADRAVTESRAIALKLWGASTPPEGSEQMVLRRGAEFVVLTGKGVPVPGGVLLRKREFELVWEPSRDLNAAELAAVRKALECPKNLTNRYWCDALEAFATGIALTPPKSPELWLGLSLRVEPGVATGRSEGLSYLFFDADGFDQEDLVADKKNLHRYHELTNALRTRQEIDGKTQPLISYLKNSLTRSRYPMRVLGVSTTPRVAPYQFFARMTSVGLVMVKFFKDGKAIEVSVAPGKF